MTDSITLEEARSRLSRIGKTAADVAREVGVSQYVAAAVLAGRTKGTRGDAHKVAVALGLKVGMIVEGDMSLGEAMKAAAA